MENFDEEGCLDKATHVYEGLLDRAASGQGLTKWRRALEQLNCAPRKLDDLWKEVQAHRHPIKDEFVNQINKDLNRTGVLYFSEEEQKCMRRVCLTYAATNPEVGYCQAMGPLVAFLIRTAGTEKTDEEDVFHVFSAIMHADGFGFQEFHKSGFPMLHRYCRALRNLAQLNLPRLHQHLEDLDKSDHFFDPAGPVGQWFKTLFAKFFPPCVAEEVLDLIICRGPKGYGQLEALIRIAFSVLTALESWLLRLSDYAQIQSFLASFRYTGGRDREGLCRCWLSILQQGDEDDVSSELFTDNWRMLSPPAAAGLCDVTGLVLFGSVVAAAASMTTVCVIVSFPELITNLPQLVASMPLPAVASLTNTPAGVPLATSSMSTMALALMPQPACEGHAPGAASTTFRRVLRRIVAPLEELAEDAAEAVLALRRSDRRLMWAPSKILQ